MPVPSMDSAQNTVSYKDAAWRSFAGGRQAYPRPLNDARVLCLESRAMMMPASSELTQLPEALSDSKLQMGSSWPPMGLSLDVVILEAETSKAAISPHDVPALTVIARVC